MCACVFGFVREPLGVFVGAWRALVEALCLCQVFREHAIDGETLALLTEEHLLSTLGLKLAPALRIRLQVHQGPRLGVCVCVAGVGQTSCRVLVVVSSSYE